MVSSGLLITACEKVKKPIFSEVQVVGLGNFSHLTETIGELAFNEFESGGYIASTIRYRAMTDCNGRVINCDNESEAHEQFLVLMKKEGIKFRNFRGIALDYFTIFDESAATAINEYSLLKVSGEQEEILNSVKRKRQFGIETYDFMRRVLDLEEITEQEIKEFANRSFIHHNKKNWASMFIDLKYFGLIDSCYRIVEKYGIEQGQKELVNLAKILIEDETAEKFIREIETKSGAAIQKIRPITEDIVKRGWIRYQKDEDNFLNILFFGPRRQGDLEKCTFFADIKQKITAEYKKELDLLGELWMDVWANEIITSG